MCVGGADQAAPPGIDVCDQLVVLMPDVFVEILTSGERRLSKRNDLHRKGVKHPDPPRPAL